MSKLKPQDANSTQVIEKERKASLFKVIIHNDDYTPMDFVVHVLEKFFQKNSTEAEQIMLDVHHKGAGVAGIYTKDIAETKSLAVNEYSRMHEHPLKTSTERE